MVETRDTIEPLAGDWDELADRTGAPPFLRPGWIGAWWGAFGGGTLELLALRREGRLAGILPLYRRGAVIRSTTNVHASMFEPLAEDEVAAEELARALFSRGARRVSVFYLAPGGPGLRALRRAAGAARYRLIEGTHERSPYIEIAGDWDAYRARLDTKLLSEVRRRRRRLEAEGRLSLEVADGGERLHELLEEGLRVEAAAWKGAVGTSISSSPETRRFYSEAAAWAAGRGLLRLAFLRLDGRPLAFDYCLEDGGAHYLVKTGYDPEHRGHAPGVMMRHDMIARAFSAGLSSYEFLGHDDSWKLRWTETCRERVVARAFAPSPAGVLNWASVAYARPLAKRLLRRR